MANTIQNFLIGIGFDFDKKGAKEVDGAIDGVKSKALQLGAVLAGSFGIKALTADFAAAYDSIGKFSQVFGVVPNDVAALGRALEHEGGSLESFMQQLEGIERLRAGLLTGDASFFEAAGRAGIDPSQIINARNATEAYIALADQFEQLNRQQRINAADALGLDEASIRLLAQGSDAVRDAMLAEQEMRPVTEEMTKAAKEFNDEFQDLFTNIGGFADNVSSDLVPAITDIVGGLNEWIAANRELANSNLDSWSKRIATNLDLVGTAGAGVAASGILGTFAGLASSVPIVGGAVAAVASGMAAIAAPLGAIAAAVVAWDWDANEFERRFGYRPPDWFFDPLFTIGNPDRPLDAQNSPTMQELQNSADPLALWSNSAPGSDATQPMTQPGFSAPIPPRANSRGGNVTLENNIILDGRIIDKRVRDVTNEVYRSTMDDLETSTGG